jgi:hypothetical protein
MGIGYERVQSAKFKVKNAKLGDSLVAILREAYLGFGPGERFSGELSMLAGSDSRPALSQV